MPNLKSINYISYPGGLHGNLSVEEFLALAKNDGFEAVEVSIDDGAHWGIDFTKSMCDNLLEIASKIDIKIASASSGNYWRYALGDSSKLNRDKAKKNLERMLEITSWLRCKTLLVITGSVFIPFDPARPVQSYDEVLNYSKEGLHSVLPTAENLGVRMAVENVGNKFLLSPTEMASYIDSFNSDKVGAYVDVGNLLLYGYPEQWIRILKHRVFGVHFKDFRTAVGTDHGYVDLLQGDVNFPAVMDAIREIGYEGPIVAELLPGYKHYPEIQCRLGSIAMDAILQRS